jgi:ABC-type glycerol-3-phosphate transport system substrate-binding protein
LRTVFAAASLSRRALIQFGAASAAGAAATALAACGATTGGKADNASSAALTPAKLTYLHQWSPTQGHGPITDTLVARWNQENPTIQLEGIFTSDYYVKLAAVLAGGDFPDLITYNLAFLPLLVKKGVVVPAETLSKGTYRLNTGDLVPAAKEMATFEGKLAVAPYVLNSSGLALNASLYKQKGLDPAKPPTTWDELLDQSKRLTGRDGDKEIWGTVFPKGTADPISPLIAFIWQNGGELVDEKKKVAIWNSPEGVEALQYQVDLVQRHRVAPYPNPANGEMGNVGIWHIPPGNVSALELRVKGAFQWTTAELPKGKRQATTVGGHSLAVLKTNKAQEQAWRFVHWYTTPAVNAEYLVATTTLPPWRASEQHALWQKYTKDEPRIQPFTKMLSYARATPKFTRWEETITILGQARDDAATQVKTAREALDFAARQADPLLAEG